VVSVKAERPNVWRDILRYLSNERVDGSQCCCASLIAALCWTQSVNRYSAMWLTRTSHSLLRVTYSSPGRKSLSPNSSVKLFSSVDRLSKEIWRTLNTMTIRVTLLKILGLTFRRLQLQETSPTRLYKRILRGKLLYPQHMQREKHCLHKITSNNRCFLADPAVMCRKLFLVAHDTCSHSRNYSWCIREFPQSTIVRTYEST
jgi:hypothetical protein